MKGEETPRHTAALSLMLARGRATGKRVQANLGAKNHAVIMPDGGLLAPGECNQADSVYSQQKPRAKFNYWCCFRRYALSHYSLVHI